MDEHSRRDLLRLPLAASALAVTSQAFGQGSAKPRNVIDEFDPGNIFQADPDPVELGQEG